MTLTEIKIQSLGKKLEAANEISGFQQYVECKRAYFFFKRIFDVVISLLVISLLLSWLTPFIALLIILDSPGPVFFIQRRVGRMGRAFRCLKFRTMVINDEANTRQAEENDLRITRFGNFLRKSNLDEFPQFFNVLLGNMSIVGPRPHMHADCARFSAVISDYKKRNIVKPGITGLAQSKGFRGPTKDFTSIFHRYQFDTFYIRNACFGLDMRIIRKTASLTLLGIVSYFSRFFAKENENRPLHIQLSYVARNVLISILPILLCLGFGIV